MNDKVKDDLNEVSVMDYTLKELQELEEFGRDATFNSVVIVPIDEIHESGFRCMKFVLLYDCDIVGVVGGISDVIHPNGIGNYGWNSFTNSVALGKIPYMNLSIDCLPGSNCVRLMVAPSKVRDDYILSDFTFYTVDELKGMEEIS